jgi:hypothetical protein
MKRFVAGVIVGLSLTAAATALAAGPWPGTYAWFNGDSQAGIGRLGTALSAFSNGDFNIHANHLRVESVDGNVELESGKNGRQPPSIRTSSVRPPASLSRSAGPTDRT